KGHVGGWLMSSVTGHAMSNGPVQSSARSWPEKAATTPGMESALDRSTPPIFACAYGLRTMCIHSIPWAVRSSVYFAWPVSNSGSSFRRTGVPITRDSVFAMWLSPLRLRAAQLPGGSRDTFNCVLVGGAAAEVVLRLVK